MLIVNNVVWFYRSEIKITLLYFPYFTPHVLLYLTIPLILTKKLVWLRGVIKNSAGSITPRASLRGVIVIVNGTAYFFLQVRVYREIETKFKNTSAYK